jgi:hypothetical protein
MTPKTHKIFVIFLTIIVIGTFVAVGYYGSSYYKTGIEQRYFHPQNETLKPSGLLGHGYGMVGSALIILGIALYMIRKRIRRFSRLGKLKHWLEFHIFLCTLGPVLVMFHSSFKIGGIVAVSFWSMVAVFLSGIVGRFIYIQIPRTIEGRELSLGEVRNLKTDISGGLSEIHNLDAESSRIISESTKKKVEVYQKNIFLRYIKNYFDDRKSIGKVKSIIKKNNLLNEDRKKILTLVANEISLNRRIERLTDMQNTLKYWHVAHLPFAIVMIIIMIIHVIVALTFGYHWVF